MIHSTTTASCLLTALRSAVLGLLLCLLPACAARGPLSLPSDYLEYLACRIVSISDDRPKKIEPLADVNLDTTAGDPAAQSFETVIHNGRTLAARVQHVRSGLPRDRFNVSLAVDGKSHLRMNHVDLDIYVETSIDDRVYALHCFPEFVEIGSPQPGGATGNP